MDIFVTGGTGFIGSYVVKALSDAGHRVEVLARNPEKAAGLKDLPGVRFVRGDLADEGKLREALEGKGACVHAALHWGEGALSMLQHDTVSSVRLFELAADCGVGSILYTSSTSVNDWVYTDDDARRQGERCSVFEETKGRPVTYYGATKGATELYLNALAFQRNLRANVIRPGYTFGNPVVADGVTQADTRFKDIVHRALGNEPIEVIRHDGTQFIWAGDLARLYVAVLESSVGNRTFFGLSSRFVSWERVAGAAIELCGSTSQLLIKDLGWPEKPALFDVSAMDREFGFQFDPWEHIMAHLRYYLTHP